MMVSVVRCVFVGVVGKQDKYETAGDSVGLVVVTVVEYLRREAGGPVVKFGETRFLILFGGAGHLEGRYQASCVAGDHYVASMVRQQA